MDSERLKLAKDSVGKLEGARILVAGEVGIDEYLWGEARRISPEAPVPIVEVISQDMRLGLAGNVAQNIVSLGGKVDLVTVRGEDSDGDKLEEMIQAVGIQRSFLLRDSSRPTLRKVRVIAEKQHVVRVDYERSHRLDPVLAQKFTHAIYERLPTVDGIIIQDYGKGIWNSDTMAVVRRAKELDKPVFVDPNRISKLSLYQGATLLTPNLVEAEILTGQPHVASKVEACRRDRLSQMAQKILNVTQADATIITCGPMGMVSLSRDQSDLVHIPTFARDVFDVTGAGDTVISVLSMALVTGFSLREAMHLANAAAGLVVAKMGAASVSPDELVKELARV